MNHQVIAIDQSTSATKAMLFSAECKLLNRVNIEHHQYYPQQGWVEHDPVEIYNNTVEAIRKLIEQTQTDGCEFSLAITNQRETVVVEPSYRRACLQCRGRQCQRGAALCNALKEAGHEATVRAKSGLMIDPFFSATGVKWILDNVDGAAAAAAEVTC